ncbi:MAG: radical SAM protein [Clostridia bacterium]
MDIIEKVITVQDYLTKSNLPVSDYVINPYVGCPHGCKYCYATFMKRFTGHQEDWGSFVDVKTCGKPLSAKKLTGKTVYLSSVTDCYNPVEEKYGITRRLLEELTDIDCEVGITTKSKLILRDLDVLKRLKHLKVSMSINTLDEGFKEDMDHASAISDRLRTLEVLHENGIHAALFISPIFPGLTDPIAIMEVSKGYVDEFWFENLNLRGSFKTTILQYISEKQPQLTALYHQIYSLGDMGYWIALAERLDEYCNAHSLCNTNFFYHSQLVKAKLAKQAALR